MGGVSPGGRFPVPVSLSFLRRVHDGEGSCVIRGGCDVGLRFFNGLKAKRGD